MIYELKWVVSECSKGWQYNGEPVACSKYADLLGWPIGKDVKVKVEEYSFPGSHYIEIDCDALDTPDLDLYPLYIGETLVDDHYYRVSEILELTEFYVGLV